MHVASLQVDEEDAEERAQLRRKQIEAANKMLYDDTDRPKALHSRLLLSDVMQERVVQMDYAKQIKSLKRAQHDAFLVQQAARLKVILRIQLAMQHTLQSCWAHLGGCVFADKTVSVGEAAPLGQPYTYIEAGHLTMTHVLKTAKSAVDCCTAVLLRRLLNKQQGHACSH